MNILLTCAGRRNYLVDFFRYGQTATTKIVGADADGNAAALQECDVAYQVPYLFAPEYINHLLAICVEESIDLVVSLSDLELPVLARSRCQFEEVGAKLLVSSPAVIDLCFDKLETARWLTKLGIKTALTFASVNEAIDALDASQVSFPLVVKPRWGSASIGVHSVFSVSELMHTVSLVHEQLVRRNIALGSIQRQTNLPDIVIQETLTGKEYGIDVLNDFNGSVRSIYVKEKLAMRAGETDKACVREHVGLDTVALLIGSNLKHIGNLDCDVFVDGDTASVLELNPRFGGGYPFSHLAGANYPAAVMDWAAGREHDCSKFGKQFDTIFAKADGLVEIGKPVLCSEALQDSQLTSRLKQDHNYSVSAERYTPAG
ncbi:MAG: ATP-grasp domain-containing protein [Granulosicoccus sp.]